MSYKALTIRNCYIPDEFVGHFMVILFFLLSGRVLGVSILAADKSVVISRISAAFIRRPIRLGFPVLIVLSVCFIFRFLHYAPHPDTPEEYRNLTRMPIHPLDESPRFALHASINHYGDVLLHFMSLFTNNLAPGDTGVLDGVVWTIPIEYVGSNFVYVIAIICHGLKSNFKYGFLAFISFFAWWNASYNFVFAAGFAVCCLQKDGYFEKCHKSRYFYPLQVLLFSLCILFWFLIKLLTANNFFLDSYSFVVFEGILGKLAGTSTSWYDPMTSLSIASIILLVMVEMNPALQRGLSTEPFVFLGRISFSFYLYHLLIIYTVITRFWKLLHMTFGVPFEMAFVCSFGLFLVISIPISYLLTIWIDEPIVNIAKSSMKKVMLD